MIPEDFSETFGPCWEYADYSVGQTVAYQWENKILTGEILWIAAPGRQYSEKGAIHTADYIIDAPGFYNVVPAFCIIEALDAKPPLSP